MTIRLLVAGAVAAGVALGVVGVAFQNAPSTSPAAAAKTISPTVAAGSSRSSSREELLRTLGILPTSPTANDRAVVSCIERHSVRDKSGGNKCLRAIPEVIQIVERSAPVARSFTASLRHPKLDLTLIRSVPLSGSGENVTFFPGSWQSSPSSAQRTWGVVAGLVDHGNDKTDVLPTSVETLRAHGIALLPQFLYVGRPKNLGLHEGAIIVPDGVAKITVGMASLGGGWSVLENVTGVVHDNVATVELKMPTFQAGFGFGPGSELRITWFDAHGKAIRQTTNAVWNSGRVSPL
jgi:hypothetical protein